MLSAGLRGAVNQTLRGIRAAVLRALPGERDELRHELRGIRRADSRREVIAGARVIPAHCDDRAGVAPLVVVERDGVRASDDVEDPSVTGSASVGLDAR